jgi:hypothetical protein
MLGASIGEAPEREGRKRSQGIGPFGGSTRQAGRQITPALAPRGIDFDAACSRRNFGGAGGSTRLICRGSRSIRDWACVRRSRAEKVATPVDGRREVVRT